MVSTTAGMMKIISDNRCHRTEGCPGDHKCNRLISLIQGINPFMANDQKRLCYFHDIFLIRANFGNYLMKES